jgi:hypothetical protein
MKHVVSRTWNKNTRSEKIKYVVRALSSSGHTEAEYFKGRSYLTTIFLGKGQPTSVEESDNWNQVKISYRGKDAVEVFDSPLGPDGLFFDENFTESEVNKIESILLDNEIVPWQGYISRNRLVKPILVSLIITGLLFAVFSVISADFIGFFLSLGMSLCFMLYLLRR